MFYDIFYSLCLSKGVTPTRVAREIGIRQSTVSMWKKQGTTPKTETIRKLSKYFNVPMSYLLGATDDPSDFSKTHWAEVLSPAAFSAGYEDGFSAAECEQRMIDELWKQEGYSGSDIEGRLISAFSSLNDTGQIAAVERIEELAQIPKYQRKQSHVGATPESEETSES